MISTPSMRLLLLCLLVVSYVVGFTAAEVVANSGYPMKGANPQRNYQINKKLLCPEVAPGRTQVWSISWETKLPIQYNFYASLTQDEEGFIYLRTNSGVMLKMNSTDGTFNPDLIFNSAGIASVPTHVQGNKMYGIGGDHTIVVNTTSMQQIAVLNNAIQYINSGSYAPYGNDLMVSAFLTSTQSLSPLFTYVNTTSFTFATDLPGTNITGINPTDVIIYKNSNNEEIPITIYGASNGNPLQVWSPNYQFSIDGSFYYGYSFVQGDQLVIYYTNSYQNSLVGLYNAETGAFLRNVSLDQWQGTPVVVYNPIVFGSKSLVALAGDFGGGLRAVLVDFLNNKTILTDVTLGFVPLYSIPDNSVFLIATDPSYNPPLLISLDWDTEAINAIGTFPSDGIYGDYAMSPPIVGNDCSLYTFYDDGINYPRVVLGMKPLPISNVVPIVECINADGLGYFSYHNMEDKRIIIPYVSDRNNLSPLGVTPTTTFEANRRSKYFPLSSRVAVNGTSGSLTWQLEDYMLSFSNTAQLRCPQNVTIVLYFNTTNPVPNIFGEWIRQYFVSAVSISDSRVSVVSLTKRSIMASSFEVRLHIGVGPTNESTSEQAAQKFYDPSMIFTVNNALAQDATYSSNGITLLDLDGVPLDIQILGTLPSSPISTPTTGQPSSSQTPTSNNNNSPKTGSTSFGIVSVSMSTLFVFASVLACLV